MQSEIAMGEHLQLKPIADYLFDYLRDVIYNPTKAELDPQKLPDDFGDLAQGLIYLAKIISETRAFSRELSEGNLNCNLPPSDNEIAAPLKNLHASLKHLTWQTQMVAKGNYNQRVDFMGDFSKAFNDMIKQLGQREFESNEEKSRLKGFMANVSHEIRTPMNAVLGMSELALREDMPLALREYITAIKHSGETLLNLINDLLDFSKIESGRMEIVPEEYNLANFLNDVINIIKLRMLDSKLSFVTNIDKALPSALFGDVLRLQQVLLNLLSNAIKYTEKGSVTLAVYGKEKDNDKFDLIIEVSDTGRGIKPENIETLFDEFTQFDLHANRGIEGTGLGLSIVKGLITAMGGSVNVTSQYGEGSTFTVCVPQKIRVHTKINMNTSDYRDMDNVIRFTAPEAKILVVDDVRMNLQVAEGLMRPYKMQVDLLTNGADALKAVSDYHYDLIFMDHMMSDMDGIETVARIRRMGDKDPYFKEIPIVVLTANVVSGAREMFLKNGFNDFLSKPIDVQELGSILKRWIPQDKITEIDITESLDQTDNSNIITIDGVDTKKGINHSGGSLDGYLKTLDIFCDDSKRIIKDIHMSMDKKDLPMYTICVHALKGASAGIGARPLAEVAEALESAGRKGDIVFIRAHNEKFLARLKTLMDEIAKLIPAQDNSTLSYDLLKSTALDLKKAMQEFDIPMMHKSAKALEPFAKSDDDIADIVSKILLFKLTGDYDEAGLLIDALTSKAV